jgi:hypothetical protein
MGPPGAAPAIAQILAPTLLGSHQPS